MHVLLSYKVEICIHGYYLYHIWTAEVDESLVYGRKPSNSSDRYAATVLKDDVVVSHLPRQLPQILSWFILRNGTIDCIVTSERRYSTDLPQGGLENPCKLLFSGKHEDITKSSAL